MTTSTGPIRLDEAPMGVPLSVASTPLDPEMAHRMSALGWRVGAPVIVVQKASGRTRVLDLSGGRVAVSRGLAHSVTVEA